MKPALLVLAAGMGSRYGGLKQMDHFGPCGETIMDYSIYDAKRAGFEKVVFVTRKDIISEFKQVVVKKYENIMNVEICFQELDMVPTGFKIPADRIKPWGTAHAVLVARDKLSGPFGVINADDFYGFDSYRLLYSHLSRADNNECCVIGYPADKTLSEHGFVSRGILGVDQENYLREITEKKIRRNNHSLVSQNSENKEDILLGNIYVSMNQIGFVNGIFDLLSENFENFLKNSGSDKTSEIFLPTFLNDITVSGKFKVKMYPTKSQWFGVTYKEDKPLVEKKLQELIVQGEYPGQLW